MIVSRGLGIGPGEILPTWGLGISPTEIRRGGGVSRKPSRKPSAGAVRFLTYDEVEAEAQARRDHARPDAVPSPISHPARPTEIPAPRVAQVRGDTSGLTEAHAIARQWLALGMAFTAPSEIVVARGLPPGKLEGARRILFDEDDIEAIMLILALGGI